MRCPTCLRRAFVFFVFVAFRFVDARASVRAQLSHRPALTYEYERVRLLMTVGLKCGI